MSKISKRLYSALVRIVYSCPDNIYNMDNNKKQKNKNKAKRIRATKSKKPMKVIILFFITIFLTANTLALESSSSIVTIPSNTSNTTQPSDTQTPPGSGAAG